jgi:hypothetical protein
MELDRSIFFNLNDRCCEFRNLHPTDVSGEYIHGLKKQNKYLMNVPQKISFESQKNYIEKIIFSNNDCIFGIFVNNDLIGTSGIQLSQNLSKYVNSFEEKIATIGIFIFHKKILSSGFGKILVWSSTYLYHFCTGTKWFGAGMENENIPSIKSFLSCGFNKSSYINGITRVYINYEDLIKPDNITNTSIIKID